MKKLFALAPRYPGIAGTFRATLILFLFVWNAQGTDAALKLDIRLAPRPVLEWPSRLNARYRIEVTSSLASGAWTTLLDGVSGTGAWLNVTNESAPDAWRFYRLIELPSEVSISPDAIVPVPGVIYGANSLLGIAPLGVQYRIPAAWKGVVRQGSSTMLFGSDTEPGLVIGVLTLAGDAAFITRILPSQFKVDDFGGYSASLALKASGNRVVGEWTGYGSQQGAIMRLVGTVHSSGGMMGFFGLFTPPNRSVMERILAGFADSTVAVPRQTDQTWVDGLRGRAFKWAAYKSTGNGGNSGALSSWSDNNAFFCDGTYEVTRYSESSYSGTLSGGAFYGGGSSSSSTEAGDWTVVRTAAGPVLILLSGSGIQAAAVTLGPSGNTFYFGDQEFSLTGPHNCISP